MKKVLILGATGMLGSAVYGALKDKYDLTLTVRSKEKIALLESAYGDTDKHRVIEFDARNDGKYLSGFFDTVRDVDFAINAIGITQPFAAEDPALTYFVNGDLPHLLAKTFGPHLIHIATDGVYDGTEGPYDENATKNPIGIYAESKSRGEPVDSLTLRTSILGRELEGYTSLVEWFLQQEGKTIKGFAEHYWNGVTAKEFGNVCDRIMSHPEKYPSTGIYHIFSNTVSKYEILVALKEKFDVRCTIVPEHEHTCNRTLSTIYDFNKKLSIPSFKEMLAGL